MFFFEVSCVQQPAVHFAISSSYILHGLPLGMLLALCPKSKVFRKRTFSIWQVQPNRWSSVLFLLAVQASYGSILFLDRFVSDEVFSWGHQATPGRNLLPCLPFCRSRAGLRTLRNYCSNKICTGSWCASTYDVKHFCGLGNSPHTLVKYNIHHPVVP